MFEISVLGPIEVRRDGVDLRVPAGKASELLVRLALDAGTVVRTDRLLDDLWGDAAVTTLATPCSQSSPPCRGGRSGIRIRYGAHRLAAGVFMLARRLPSS